MDLIDFRRVPKQACYSPLSWAKVIDASQFVNLFDLARTAATII